MRRIYILVLSLFLVLGLAVFSSCSDDTKPFEKPPVEKPDEKPDKPDKPDEPDVPEEPEITGKLDGPPLPPRGKRWVRNEMLSDEFSGTELDRTKWADIHPTWIGRPPGLFMPSQVSVKDGYLQLKGEKMAKDTIIKSWSGEELLFNVKAGIVISKATAFTGYYECKVKAAATTMSTTFWFSTGSNSVGPKGCDSYGLEWDIQECIGKTGNFQGNWFAKGMHSNSHYWYTDCDGVKHDYRAKEVRFEDDELASENFHVYGGWWRDERTASYYYDNSDPKHQTFYDMISHMPFDRPMHMRLAHETYPFPWIELPSDADLADPTKNTVYYDWVRSYDLVDVNDPNLPVPIDPNLATNGGFETGDLTGWGGWGTPIREVINDSEHVNSGISAFHIAGVGALTRIFQVLPNTEYRLSAYTKVVSGSITLSMKEGADATVNCTESDYTKKTLTFTTDNSGSVKMVFYSNSEGGKGYIDDIELVETNPKPIEPAPIVELYVEDVTIDKKHTFSQVNQTIYAPYTYRANEDREIQLTLYNSENEIVATNVITAYAGYANTGYIFNVDEKHGELKKFTVSADIRPIGGADADIIYKDEYKHAEKN